MQRFFIMKDAINAFITSQTSNEKVRRSLFAMIQYVRLEAIESIRCMG